MKSFLLLCLLILPIFGAQAQRQTVDLHDGWKFLRQDAAPDAPVGADWQSITVPHGWNALDGQDGQAAEPSEPAGYYRGPAWYAQSLDAPAAWKGKRVFIRFGAAFLVADVYLNGEHLGQHQGGFAAFCYELTSHLKLGDKNELRVRVDNSVNPDVAPLDADFTMEGGLYRPVQVLVTDQACITPLDFAGPGVYVTPGKISENEAHVEVETKLDTAGAGMDTLQVETEIRDAAGTPVSRQQSPAAATSIKQSFDWKNPHFWNGRRDPYLYTVNVRLLRAGRMIDEVTQPLGLRLVEVDEAKGFLLNGKSYPVYGVNKHQEKRDQGWVLTPADNEADFQMMLDMGVTAIRLAHYQQSENVHDLADRKGLLLWQEIPLVNKITDSPAFTDNARQQLTEMIRQGYNHPSIFTWSMFNELYNSKTPPPEHLVMELDLLARQLDPTRIPTGASCHREKTDLNRITQLIGYNLYPGWYGDEAENFGKTLDKFYDVVHKRFAVSEYGAGGNPDQHQEGALVHPKPGGNFHPEEWQAHVEEVDWSQIRNNPELWGSFVWLMFDFASDHRNEGDKPGVNDKGMVTEDRKLKKDAFYFYQSNWTTQPMIYVASRRMTPRKLAQTEIKVYSNCEDVELLLNGQSMGKSKPDEIHVCRWPSVTLKTGNNEVKVLGHLGSVEVSDRCEWVLELN